MNPFQDFKPEIKLLLIVMLVAGTVTIGGILLLKIANAPREELQQANKKIEPTDAIECGGIEDMQCSDNSECVKIDPLPCARGICVPKESRTNETATWQTYRNEEFGFEFDYPDKWDTIEFEDRTTVNDEKGEPFMTLTFANRAVLGVSFCGAYRENERCEILEGDEINFIIDWGKGQKAIAEADIKDGTVAMFVTLSESTESSRKLFRQILSTFRFVSTFDSVCRENPQYSLAWTAPIQFVDAQGKGTLVVCDQKYPGESHTVYILDKEKHQVWNDGFSGHIYEKPKIIDIDKDGIDEVYWASSGCGGTCTGCRIEFYIYSQKYDERFFRTNWSVPKSPQECGMLIDQPPVFSPNLEEPRYEIFRNYLGDKKFEGENVWGPG